MILKDLFGEPGGTRTRDPLLKRQMLYRLSYRPDSRRFTSVYHLPAGRSAASARRNLPPLRTTPPSGDATGNRGPRRGRSTPRSPPSADAAPPPVRSSG